METNQQIPPSNHTPSKGWSTAKIIVGVLIILQFINRFAQGMEIFKSGPGTAENLGYNVANLIFVVFAIWGIVTGIKEKTKNK